MQGNDIAILQKGALNYVTLRNPRNIRFMCEINDIHRLVR